MQCLSCCIEPINSQATPSQLCTHEHIDFLPEQGQLQTLLFFLYGLPNAYVVPQINLACCTSLHDNVQVRLNIFLFSQQKQQQVSRSMTTTALHYSSPTIQNMFTSICSYYNPISMTLKTSKNKAKNRNEELPK